MSDTEDNIRSFHHFEDGSVVETTHIPRYIMSDTTIDDILESLAEIGRGWVFDQLDGTSFIKEALEEIESNKAQAKSALYDLILKEVVGEDEQPIDLKMTDKNTAIFLNNKIAFCNGLRAEQRNKLKELFDDHSN